MADHVSSIAPARALSRRLGGGALVALLILAAGVAGYFAAEHVGLRSLRVEARHRLDLLSGAIDAEVTRFTHIPGVLALNADILELLRRQANGRASLQPTANRYLEQLSAQQVDSLAVFVMDTRGRVVASSDWIYTDNLLNADLSHRPFFQTAIGGAPYRQYAVDVVRDEAGYFFAQPIRDERQDWKIVGVAVLKASIRGVERRWLVSDAPALVTDGNGVALLAAPPEWRFSTLQPLSDERARELVQQQFQGRSVGTYSFGIDASLVEDGVVMSLPSAVPLGGDLAARGREFLVMSRKLPGAAWDLLVFVSVRSLRAQSLTYGALAGAATATLVLWVLYLRQRRRAIAARLAAQALLEEANRDLEAKVVMRTEDLSRAVDSLQAEVAERLRAEETLREAQEELVQAGKLAVLGQLATGITHELSQPLGAIRTLAGNSIEFMRRDDQETAEKNLRIVCDLADQMGGIITPLKTFARKSPAVRESVDVARVIGSALFLLDQRLRRAGVRVENPYLPDQWYSYCDQNRLQQVLINLIGNAADAMSGEGERVLSFEMAHAENGSLVLSVSDTGCGLPAETLDRLFEPFYTTKPPGEGLGLGLAISRDIVRDFGGDLLAENRPGGGARFIIRLPADRNSETP